jgi:hypothetical protein
MKGLCRTSCARNQSDKRNNFRLSAYYPTVIRAKNLEATHPESVVYTDLNFNVKLDRLRV